MPKIEIVSVKPRVTEEQIVIDVEAALYQEKDGDQDSGMRIPNITFEVRTSVANATGISSEKGYFVKTDVLLNACEEDELTTGSEKLTITANYTERDESRKAIEEITVDISEQVASINRMKRARKEKEAARLSKEEEVRKQKAAEDERKRLKQEMYEKLEPDRKRQIKADITQAGEDIKNRERLQISPFNVLREHEDHPHAERTAIMVAAEAPERTVEALEIYKSATWASRVMKIAAEKQPLMAIKTIARYKDMDWAPEILKIAAQRHPHEVVKALSQYCEYEWCRDIILHIAETEPQAAFEEVEMWEFYPWAEEAAMAAASKAPEFTVNNFSLYQDQPWAQRVYESVVVSGKITDAEKAEVQRLLKKKITETGARLLERTVNKEDFAILYEHRFHPHSKVMMTKVAEEASDNCIKAVGVYKSAQWAKEIMVLATAKSPVTAINEIDEYVEMKWAEDVMKKAASLRPKEAICALPKYAGYRWSKTIVESIATSSPDSIFEEMEFIEYQSWAEEVATKAGASALEAALRYFALYQNQPWAGEVLEFARQEKVRKDEAAKEAKELYRQEKLIEKIHSRIIGLIDSAPTSHGWELSREFEKLVTFQSHPLSRAVAMEVARNNPDVIFWLKHSIKDASWFLDVIGAAANQYLQTGITREFLFEKSVLGSHIFGKELQMYKTEKWAEKLVLLASEWAHSSAFVDMKYYVDQPWAEKVLLLLMESSPETAFVQVNVYGDQPWAERFLERAKKAYPGKAAKYSECVYFRFEARKDSMENVFLRARQNPCDAIRFCSEYKDDPWADAVIKVAAQVIAERYTPPEPPPKMKTETETKAASRERDEQSDKDCFPMIYRIKKFFGLY